MLSKYFVLMLVASAAHAESNDTYNFYFQKAPGPVTVNQGSAPAQAPKTTDVVVSPAPSVPASVAQAMVADSASSGLPSWELSLGVAASSYGGGEADPYGYVSPVNRTSGMVNAPQFTASVQYNLSEAFALQGDAYYLTHPESTKFNGVEVTSQGSAFDYGMSLVVTPLRLKAFSTSHLNLSALLGGMSVPVHKSGFDSQGAHDGKVPLLAHAGSLTYGARAALELGRHVAVAATVRRIARYSSTQGTGAVTFLF